MKILAIETSAVTCSAAFYDGEHFTEEFVNNGLNHSKTLMPLVESVLNKAGVAPEEIELFACSAGPGSFTGVRIGVASLKGMAAANSKPCIGVSTLEAIALSAEIDSATVCCVMDARRGQFYNALFDKKGDSLTRLTPDAAESGEVIAERIEKMPKQVLIMGDGAKAFSPFAEGLNAVYPEGEGVYQRAIGVIKAALNTKQRVKPGDLAVNYLRPSQAEREYAKRNEQKEGN